MKATPSRLLVWLLLGGTVAPGCTDDPVQPGGQPLPPPTPVVWNQIRGGLGVGAIRSLDGVSQKRVFAVHAGGILLHDGSRWSVEPVPPSIPPLNAVWAASPTEAFAVGDDGLVLHRTGAGWVEMNRPTGLDIVDVQGNSPADVYAVARTDGQPDAAELLHYDGTAWLHVDTHDGADANAVACVPGLAFVVCDDGVVFRHDGSARQEDNSLVAQDLLGVWAASATDAFAVGEGGRVLRWNGTIWVPMASNVTTRLRAVTGASASDVVAVGDDGVVLHFDGAVWMTGTAGTANSLAGVCMFQDGHGIAAGESGTVVMGSAGAWAPRNAGQPFTLESVWSSNGYYIAVGSGPGGGVIRDRYGYGWDFPRGIHAIAGAADLVFVAGDDGAIYRYVGGNFPSVWQPEASPTTATLRGMTGLVSRFGEPFRVYAVGDAGTLLMWKGGAWSLAAAPAGAENHAFVDVWAAAIDDVFAVAGNATSIARYDDPYELGGWTLEDTPSASPLLAVTGWRGSTYIASEAGEIFFNDGSGWTLLAHPVNVPVRDMRTLAENSIFAVGDEGVILHFDGATWSRTESRFAGELLGIWGNENPSVNLSLFAVGADGAVLLHKR